MFQKPEKISVVDKEIERLTAKAIISGRRVPRSPNEPEISASGDLLRVATLFLLISRMFEKAMFSTIFVLEVLKDRVV